MESNREKGSKPVAASDLPLEQHEQQHTPHVHVLTLKFILTASRDISHQNYFCSINTVGTSRRAIVFRQNVSVATTQDRSTEPFLDASELSALPGEN